MTTEEAQILTTLSQKAWDKYKPNIPFENQSVDWDDFALAAIPRLEKTGVLFQLNTKHRSNYFIDIFNR